jgi:RNA polymerase sigma-70 factor (ECF subfamily)
MARPASDPLIQGLAEGRDDAFAALYDKFGQSLFRVAFAMSGSRPDAEDAVQEVFLGLVRARAKLSRVENLRAYLFTSLRHTIKKTAGCHKAKRAFPAIDSIPGYALGEERSELGRSVRLERALSELPKEQREMITLKVDGDLTFAEIASLLGISANTGASRYRYALEKLRAALKEPTDE